MVVGNGFCDESMPDAIVEQVTATPDGFVIVHAIIPGVGIESTKQFEPTSRPEPAVHEYVVVDIGAVTAPDVVSVHPTTLRVEPVGHEVVRFAVAGAEVPAGP